MRRSCAFTTFALLLATVSESSRISSVRLTEISQEIADRNAKLKDLAAAPTRSQLLIQLPYTRSNVDPEKQKKALTAGVSLAFSLIAALGDDSELAFDFALQSLGLQGWKFVKTVMDGYTKIDSMRKAKQAWQIGIELLRSWLNDFRNWGHGETPNYQHAIATTQAEGWKIVKTLSSDPNSEYMRSAKKAWDWLFENTNQLRQVLRDAVATGDKNELILAIQPTIDSALRTGAEALPEKAPVLNAVADLIGGLTGSWTSFAEEVDRLRDENLNENKVYSLVQVSGEAGVVPKYIDREKLKHLLIVGVGILTSLMTAVDQDPIDFEHLFDSLRVQGWRMATLILPEEYQKGEWIKKIERAWGRVFSKATDVAEHAANAYKKNDIMALVNTCIITVETALLTCADVAAQDRRGQFLIAVADLWSGVGGSLVQFSLQMEWLKPSDDDYDGPVLLKWARRALRVLRSSKVTFTPNHKL